MTAVDDATRTAVRAFYRLHKALQAVQADPFHPGALESLENTSREANDAMKAGGLLDLPPADLFALVTAEFPDFNSAQ